MSRSHTYYFLIRKIIKSQGVSLFTIRPALNLPLGVLTPVRLSPLGSSFFACLVAQLGDRNRCTFSLCAPLLYGSLGARKGAQDSAASSAPDADEAASSAVGPHLVNKQMVLPFIPPKFPSAIADSNVLIKPSEYLRSITTGKSTISSVSSSNTESVNNPLPTESPAKLTAPTPVPPQSPSVPIGPGPPPPPLPDQQFSLPPAGAAPTLTSTRKQQQPLGAISIQDLNSVQLRRTEKMLASKTVSAPPKVNILGKPGKYSDQTLLRFEIIRAGITD